METVAPPIVAVIVTCDPGEWFEECLGAFAAQDYPELSILVLDAASAVDPTPRVAAVVPGAFVRRLPTNQGFGATANAVLTMVEGASHLLLCHDDVAPDPDAVHVMVEESFRSNAGIVAPKIVSWADPTRLLHVGMAVDKGGAVVDRVQPGEIDHGQHDAVRDVFLAPGACTLVRSDLFAELGGFDPEIFAMGEDLDLCWRAQVLGARVIVAPQARVRHLEMLASGHRRVPGRVRTEIHGDAAGPGPVAATAAPGAPGAPAPAGASEGHEGPGEAAAGSAPGAGVVVAAADGAVVSARPPRGGGRGHRRVARETLQSMQRRHELYAALKAYGPFHLLRVIPQVALLAVAEMVVATLAGHRDRAAAVAHAWRWTLSRRRIIRRGRAEVGAHRRLTDAEVRRLQLHGSARVNAYVRRAFTHGIQAANVGGVEGDEDGATSLVDVGAGEAGDAPGGDQGPATSTKWAVWLAAAFVVVLGTRQLLGSGFPVVGQLLPFPSWATLIHRYLSGWQPTGVGTTAPATPATGLLGLAGMVLFGSVGLLQKIVVLGCIPVGALGMARLTRPLGTAWARVTSTVIYLAVPVPYDALASGRWDALVMYASCPWILHLLGQASRVDPYGLSDAARRATRATPGRPLRPWRKTLAGWSVALGLLDAVVTSVAPSGAVVTLVIAAGLALGSVVVGGRAGVRAAGRVVATAAGATAVAVVLLAPWSLSTLAGGGRWQVLAGLPVPATSGAGWGELLRLAAGPIGDAALAWMFLAAAALPLVIGARWRLAWAGRAWTIAVVAWVVAWVAGRGWLGSVGLAPQVLVAPAGMAIALSIGLGVAAFQLDLPGYRFGWRQAAAVAAAAAAAIGMLPVLAGSLGGRWGLVPTGYGEATSWMTPRPGQAGFRVLWLGDPRVLPGTGWALAPGLAYTLSADGLPDVTDVWSGASPGAASTIGSRLQLARRGDTVRLGRLLAPYAVRYVVVVDTLAPSVPGLQSPVAHPPPSDLVPALSAQIDLRQIISEQGFEVFEDPAALPLRAVRSGAPTRAGVASTVTGTAPELSGWRPALVGPRPDATSATGRVPAGTVFAAVAPADRWQVRAADGRVLHRTIAFGFAPAFVSTRTQVVTLRVAGSASHAWETTAQIVAWVVVTAALLGRRRWLDWWWGPVRGRRRGRARSDDGSSPHDAPPSRRDPVGVPPGTGVAGRAMVSVAGEAALGVAVDATDGGTP